MWKLETVQNYQKTKTCGVDVEREGKRRTPPCPSLGYIYTSGVEQGGSGEQAPLPLPSPTCRKMEIQHTIVVKKKCLASKPSSEH